MNDETIILTKPAKTVTTKLPPITIYETIKYVGEPYKEITIHRDTLNPIQKLLLKLFF
jgi:hypothetical protein